MKKFLNFIKNPKLKMICILAFLLFIYTTICAISYAKSVSEDLENSVFRLHVIANSDSKEDQNLKYIVRDKLLQYMNSYLSNTSTKEDAIKIANEHLDEFKQVAINTIKEQGYSYNVNVKVGNFEFPTKTYGDISLPAGFYDALRVEIGEAKGQNWWCVMFPPLCFVDVTSGVVPEESKKELQNNLSEEEFALISDNQSSNIQFKFKLLEFFTDNGIITAKK
ncbi:stage II sporulation protein R [Clostridium sp. CAG:440]|jgi:stage II sporulation protein R|nr:stage II sporulation protein R [Clostridium sp. CAG:440]HJJ15291.1 stage II sporulation protein R [Clostridiaceae bacterium]